MSEQPAAAAGVVSPSRFLVRAVLRTDVGLVRSENQDFGTCTTTEEEKESHPGGRLFVVADGMGGHRGGATASRIAAETVKAQFLGSETTDIPTALRESLTRANARIYSEAQANPDLRGMGTTTSVLAVRNDQAWLGHVGDSRIYRIRGEEISQLTDDHSLVASMVREGLLTPKEAETHPRRNVLQRSMGVADDVEIDVRGPFELRDGDTFVLCSDGLHGLVKEDELKEIAKRDITAAADEYLARTLERGAPDNVTVIVARVERIASDPPSAERKLDDTQPFFAADISAFDETQRDRPDFEETHKLDAPVPRYEPPASPARPAPPIAASPLAPAAVSAGAKESGAPPVATSALPESQPTTDAVIRGESDVLVASEPAGASFLKWMLLVVIALGAAGAWLYWTR
jgi:serine/threonine protein phosphatase PrpC